MASQKALDAAPAYRVIVVGTSSLMEGTNRMTLEVLRPDLARYKVELNGKVAYEAVTDGKKTVVSEAGGAYKEAPANLVSLLATARSQASIDAPDHDDLTHKVGGMKLVGHEAVNDVQASVYGGESDTEQMGHMHNVAKVWISDRDHRPLQAEWNVDGTLKMDPAGEGQPMKQTMKMTFEYDPAIKFDLPAVP